MTYRLITYLLLAGFSQSVFAVGLSFSETQHLLTRTGFTPSFFEVTAIQGQKKTDAVQAILDSAQHPDGLQADGAFTEITKPLGRSATQSERDMYRQMQRESVLAMQQWWLGQMLTTQTPFAEQLTLFWHNHFVSSIQKVKYPALMYQQNQLYRSQALGNYRQLVHDMAKSPAMILYLDNQTNKKGQPNENFARELFELFTLGEGHYTESDVKAAARAFTGWQLDRNSGAFSFNKRQHDSGLKTLFGQTGSYDGEAVIDLIFTEKPEQVAVHLVSKWWLYFISTEPDVDEVNRLAQIFINADFELRPLMEALLLSPHFWSSNQPLLVKSPVDLVVGTQRIFGLNITDKGLLRQMGGPLEQQLFSPPNVKGWPGGNAWISSTTLLARAQLMGQTTRAIAGMAGASQQPKDSLYSSILAHPLAEWRGLLLPHGGIVAEVDAGTQPFLASDYPNAISALIEDPLYQLK